MKQLAWIWILMFVCTSKMNAQKQTTHVQQTWVAYLNQTRFSDRWGLWADFHLRTKEDFFTDLSTGIARLGLTYYANDHLKITAGYAYINYFPADGHTSVTQPEHRPWQQVQWNTNSKKSRILQAVRFEQRFRRKILNNEELADGYNFNYRLRYNFALSLPLSRNAFAPHTLSFVLNDEILVNMGKEIVYNYFDQNRFFAGFTYHVTSHGNLQFGYMNVFQQMAAGNRYRSIHVPRVFYFHTLDLRNKRS